MAITRAENNNKKSSPVMQRGVSMANSIKGRAHKHKEKMPIINISIAMLVLFFLMMIYVVYVNKASTYGYFYKTESQELENIKSEYNLLKLTVLKSQKKVREQGDDFSAWSNPAALRSRLINIDLTNLSSE